MELHEQMENVQTKEDLAKFIAGLRTDLDTQGQSWENPTLERFLEAMAAWLAAKDHLEKNQNRPSEDLTWKAVAKMLYAAKIYE
jgi:hypothetical protein